MTTPETTKPEMPAKTKTVAKTAPKPKAPAKKTAERQGIGEYVKKFPGLPAQGSAVQYLGGARIRNDWLKPKAIGRVRGFHKNQEDGARLVVFFGQGHSTILSATHVKPCAAKLLKQSFARVKAKMGKTTKKTTAAKPKS